MKYNNLKVLNYPHETLLQRAELIHEFDEELSILAKEMIHVMKISNGVGLAANQVGVLKRIFVMQCDPNKEPYVFINPEVSIEDETEGKNVEGCLSFPGLGIEVRRKKCILLSWQDLQGNTKKERFFGLESICVQHEVDHLDGIVFTDRLGPVKKQMEMQRYKKMRKN